MAQREEIVKIQNLSVEFSGRRGVVHAVNDVTYTVHRGEILGIVGESGSGKSTSAYALMRLLPRSGKVTAGGIEFDGRDILSLSDREIRSIRGADIGMIFQDPMLCLDPLFTIGDQLTETLRSHKKMTRSEAEKVAADMLAKVGIHDPGGTMKRYQHELSGGMRQRVMIAMALMLGPKLLIADEPTTALDVTIQDQILGLLKDAAEKNDMSMIFITHNFGIVADICDRVCVMYGGYVMEQGTVDELFYDHRHPYTDGLLNAIPKADLLNKERLSTIEGTPIDVFTPPSGCVFHPRCAGCMDICRKKRPPAVEVSPGHTAACWLCVDRDIWEADNGY